jgi:hypothetical protein
MRTAAFPSFPIGWSSGGTARSQKWRSASGLLEAVTKGCGWAKRLGRGPLNTEDSFDENNVLKDGKKIRVAMTARDAVMSRHAGRVTDATGDPLGLHKPGFRIRAGDSSRQKIVSDAYAKVTSRQAIAGNA